MVFKMSRLAGGFAGVAALTVACGGVNSDRAGGAANVDPVVLTMAQNSDVPPSWLHDVGRRCRRAIRRQPADRVRQRGWRYGEPEFETGTIDDVQAGEVDLAFVGARAFDRVGVTSFQPLLAPLLIDSHDLQAAVFEAGIPDEMLAGLDAIDLAGIGILPGAMRKMLGVSHPFVAPADFAGQLVGIQDSALSEQTMLALGATTQNMRSCCRTSPRSMATSNQIGSIAGNEYWQQRRVRHRQRQPLAAADGAVHER